MLGEIRICEKWRSEGWGVEFVVPFSGAIRRKMSGANRQNDSATVKWIRRWTEIQKVARQIQGSRRMVLCFIPTVTCRKFFFSHSVVMASTPIGSDLAVLLFFLFFSKWQVLLYGVTVQGVR